MEATEQRAISRHVERAGQRLISREWVHKCRLADGYPRFEGYALVFGVIVPSETTTEDYLVRLFSYKHGRDRQDHSDCTCPGGRRGRLCKHVLCAGTYMREVWGE